MVQGNQKLFVRKTVCYLFEFLKVGRKGDSLKNNKTHWKVVVTVYSWKEQINKSRYPCFYLSVINSDHIPPLNNTIMTRFDPPVQQPGSTKTQRLSLFTVLVYLFIVKPKD